MRKGGPQFYDLLRDRGEPVFYAFNLLCLDGEDLRARQHAKHCAKRRLPRFQSSSGFELRDRMRWSKKAAGVPPRIQLLTSKSARFLLSLQQLCKSVLLALGQSPFKLDLHGLSELRRILPEGILDFPIFI